MAKFELGVELKLQGLFLTNPDKALLVFGEEFGKALDETSSLMLRKVDKYTPRGVTGNFAGSLFRERRGRGFGMQAVIGTPLQAQGQRLENGTPYDPALPPLIEWAKTKLGLETSHAFAVAKVIKRRISQSGMKNVAHMFQKGFAEGRPIAQMILDKAAERIKNRWRT